MDNVTLVTGGGIGIGAATAKAFARSGSHVIIADILPAEARKTIGSIEAEGGSAQFEFMDVSLTGQVDDVVARVIKQHGRIETVVANAGIAHRVPFAEMSDELWSKTLEVDLNGVMRIFRAATPHMQAQRSGNLVALSSIMGVAYGWDEHVHYSAAKSAVVGLVRGLAVELGRSGIRVNGVAPGYVRTAQALSAQHSLGEEGLNAAAEYIPLGRVGEPDEIADVIRFLASEDSRYMTGQVLVVDGGLLVGRY
jgi:3-oxoacyl-[acyl-carrier protein] reductase